MLRIKNINEFLDNLSLTGDTPIFYNKLINFTRNKKEVRDTINNSFIFKEDNGYSFIYNGRKISFSCLSDEKISKEDKNRLESKKTLEEYCIERPLKLAYSMDLVSPIAIFSSSNVAKWNILISYLTKDGFKIIDYNNNLIMNKKDYYEIFQVLEINVMDKSTIYDIYKTLTLVAPELYLFLLVFSEQFFKKKFPYDNLGINHKNNYLYGRDNDTIFFTKEDYNSKNKAYIKELSNFTENPNTLTSHITKCNDKYKFESNEISFDFSLLSENIICDEVTNAKINELLSDKRYNFCHEKAHFVASLFGPDREDVFIVAGKCKINEIDYYFHSWVEDEHFVYDFNTNTIMKKSDFYKLHEVKVINKTCIKEMQDVIKVLIEDAKLSFDGTMLINYFGKEMKDDLIRSRLL